MAITFLVLSIVFSTFINLIFKWFSVFEVDKIQAILVNYLVCFIIGFVLSGDYDILNIVSIFIPQLLSYPNPDDPFNVDAAHLMKTNKDA